MCVDQPETAKTALFLRQLMSQNASCDALDQRRRIKRGIEPFDRLKQLDEWLEEFRRAKSVEDERLMDRLVARARRTDEAS